MRHECAVNHRIDRAERRRRLAQRAQILLADGRGDTQGGAIARQRLRHVLVGRAQNGALRIKLRIVLVGLRQRPFQRVGRRATRNGAADGGHKSRRRDSPPTRRRTCHNPSPTHERSVRVKLCLPVRPPYGPRQGVGTPGRKKSPSVAHLRHLSASVALDLTFRPASPRVWRSVAGKDPAPLIVQKGFAEAFNVDHGRLLSVME